MKKWMIFITSSSLLIAALSIYYMSRHISRDDAYAVIGTPEPTKTDGGYGHIIQIRNGSVYTWGLNDNGQLGIGNTTDQYAPQRIPSSSFGGRIPSKVQAGPLVSGLLTEDKNLYLWGQGFPSSPSLRTPGFPVRDFDIGGSGVVNTHGSYAVVSDVDGSVHVWGSGYFGQYGTGFSGYGALGTCTSAYSSSTLQKVMTGGSIADCPDPAFKKIVPGTEQYLTNVNSISINNDNRVTMALTSSNEIYTWGPSYGNFARKNPNITSYTIKKIEAGTNPMFLTDDGKVYYFSGYNGIPKPISLEGTTEQAIDVYAGGGSVLILTESGKLYGIGNNDFGQLGTQIPYSGISFSSAVAKYTGLSDVKRAGLGHYHSIYQTISTDKYFGLGRNSFGQLANINDNSHSTFQLIGSSKAFKLVHATNETSYSIDVNDKLYSWGSNTSDGLLQRSGAINTPLEAFDFTPYGGAKTISGFSPSFVSGGVITGDGSFYNWGNNYKNGNGRYSNPSIPTKLTNNNASLAGENFSFINGYQGMYIGGAINSDGKVFTWGFNEGGSLGIGSFTTDVINGRTEAKAHVGLEKPLLPADKTFTKIVSGNYSQYALSSDGLVYSWGYNTSNKLGYSSGTNPTPRTITSLPPIKDIASGYDHILLLDTDGFVWSIGANQYGQLGLGHTNSVTLPVKISSLSSIKSIAAGQHFSFAINSSNELYGWGRNQYGQLGLADRNNRNEPRKVPVSDVSKVSGGNAHTLLLTLDGKMYSSGSDSQGQLGLSQSQINDESSEIIYKPMLTLDMTNNEEYQPNDTLIIKGIVESENIGTVNQIGYRIEGNSVNLSGLIETYTTSSTPQSFTKNIPLDTGHPLGGYTVYVTVTTSTGLETVSSVNYSILDKIPPSLILTPADRLNWDGSPLSATLSSADTGGSGYRGIRYAWSKSTAVPTTGWSNFDSRSSFTLNQATTGTWYLHAEASDQAGNLTYKMGGPYRFGEFSLRIPGSVTLPPVTLDGTVKTAKAAFSPELIVTETTDRGAGWNLSVKATPFTSPEGLTLPANSLAVVFPSLGSVSGGGSRLIDNGTYNNIYSASPANAYGVFTGAFGADSVTLTLNPAAVTNRNRSSETFTSTIEWVLSSSP